MCLVVSGFQDVNEETGGHEISGAGAAATYRHRERARLLTTDSTLLRMGPSQPA